MDTTEAPPTRLSRISKLFVDRDETAIEEALERRQGHAVVLHCGCDVARSYTLQLAVLTTANIASRCFPGAVRVAFDPILAEAPLLVWPSLRQTFGQALTALLGPDALIASCAADDGRAVVFGNVAPVKGALRVTFDGWIAKVGPATGVDRLPEREYCSLAGVTAAAVAISELFMAFANISVEAGRRIVAISLWRPDLSASDPAALGIPVEFLPREIWVLGLGHLGNAYLWALASLPYADPTEVEVYLNDYDKVEDENVETSLLLSPDKVRQYKTRACSDWLERRGFQTRLIERPFDASFRRRRCKAGPGDEPGLALCGFDSNPPRRDLATAQFLRVIESGLGGTPNNFDTISLHTFPNPRPAAELWPDLDPAEETKRQQQQEAVAKTNPVYAGVGHDECGRYELAGKSIAVPFVGAAAAALVTAESLRLLHRGQAYTDMKLRMSIPNRCSARTPGSYAAEDFAGLKYTDSRPLHR